MTSETAAGEGVDPKVRVAPADGRGWSSYDIHGIIKVRSNVRLPAVPDYFRVESTDPNFEVRILEDLSPPPRTRIQRIVGHTAFELGNGEMVYEAEVPIMYLLGSRAPWRFLLGGLAEDVTKVETASPFFRFPPVRYKVIQLFSKLYLLLMTFRLIRRGYAMCHATAVAKDGRAHLLFGFSGTGKSTLGASLLESGFEFMADDYAIVDAQGRVYCFPDWHRPRDSRARIPLTKYLGLTPPFPRDGLQIAPRADAGPILVMERGPSRVVDLPPDETLRRIMLLNLEELSKLWNSPLSVMLSHYAYLYPELHIEALMERYGAIVASFVDRAGPFVNVRSMTPDFKAMSAEILGMVRRA